MSRVAIMGKDTVTVKEKDLVVIGTGMAGMAASLFAARRGMDIAQIGIAGQINFASGLVDLLGVHPVGANRFRSNPWAAIDELVTDEPDHPYAKLTPVQIRSALDIFFEFTASVDLPYTHLANTNQTVLTPVGTRKATYAAPMSMATGARIMAEKRPCLIVDFKGLKGFSAAQIVNQVRDRWANIRAARISIPDTEGELNTEQFARSLESEQNRRQLADAIKPCIKGETAVGLPAILGVHRTSRIIDDLERWLGIEIFEIPTMLPAVTGLRLKESIETGLRTLGVQSFYQHKVSRAVQRADGSWLLTIDEGPESRKMGSKWVVLASGRFLGNGLHADRRGICETLFDLPVKQPENRSHWHQKDLLNLKGHPINRAGLAIDRLFRPVGRDGRPVHINLFAAGSILADQDWVRQKCGSGLAIATAYGAIEGVRASIRNRMQGNTS